MLPGEHTEYSYTEVMNIDDSCIGLDSFFALTPMQVPLARTNKEYVLVVFEFPRGGRMDVLTERGGGYIKTHTRVKQKHIGAGVEQEKAMCLFRFSRSRQGDRMSSTIFVFDIG